MARSVDQVNASITRTQTTIRQQEALVNQYQSDMKSNNQKYQDLIEQKRLMETTYSEVEELCDTLDRKILGNATGMTAFTARAALFGYAGKSFVTRYPESASNDTNLQKKNRLDKISDIQSRLERLIQKYYNDYNTACDNYKTAQTKLDTARSDLSAYQQELKTAEEEEALAAAGGI